MIYKWVLGFLNIHKISFHQLPKTIIDVNPKWIHEW